ncbi:T9SS type A sorting domain-containing protein [uncultured Flavobacterium sp.]|uniref:T9SS type A sorting domain-containing protein n=1 Tax=uncultured Flavobacterium sp. TaxID=165435 RepID=UPI0025F72314|nr:T9SS type A sorting domain-containing protein [uncultured Flavobacterium sp.]
MKALLLTIALFLQFSLKAQVAGCTDPLSSNYNPLATVNNGSCTYGSSSIAPETSVNLPAELNETSGLIKWQEWLLTHNDNTDLKLYALDSISGTIQQTFTVTGTSNTDWEEIAHDGQYVYIGDFGNNGNGNRTNLRIIRVEKEELLSGNVQANSINFSYSNQSVFTPSGANNTDFDCEAFIVSNDSIYLFTKQWVSKKTSVYALPKTPGTHIAQLKATHDVSGLITGATYLEDKKMVVLTGYSSLLQPFFYLLYDFKGHSFFSGNKRKVGMSSMGFHQVEGIATANGLDYFVSNEYFVRAPLVSVSQKLHKFNLRVYLQDYLENFSLAAAHNDIRDKIRVYPNPAGDVLYIEIEPSLIGIQYNFIDMNGRNAQSGTLNSERNRLDIGRLQSGVYVIKVSEFPDYAYRLVKRD